MLNKKKLTHTRTINPILGIMGVFGFLGFSGFVPEIYNSKDILPIPTAFFFFTFFAFFGFYYEGKMSNTLIDERFESNAYRATAISNRIAFFVIFIVSIFSMLVFKVTNTYTISSILIATISLSFGLSLFLQQYLLYRFENEELAVGDFICNLKKYRKLKEMTQEQLSEKVGVRRETIMRLEAGKYNPSLNLAINIAKIVEAPIEELFI